jgi:hypothetical protein
LFLEAIVRSMNSAKGNQEPYDDTDGHRDIEDYFHFPIYREASIDQTDRHADDN